VSAAGDEQTRWVPSGRLLRRTSGLVLLTLAAYAVAAFFGGDEAVLDPIRAIPAPQIVAVLGLSLINYGLRFARWHGYLASMGHRVPPGRHLTYYLAGFALTVSPGKAGEAVRSVYLKPHGVAFHESLAAMFAERVVDLLTIALLALALLFSFEQDAAAAWTGLGLAALAVATLGSPSLASAVERRAQRLHGRLRHLVHNLARLHAQAARLLRPAQLTAAVAVGLVAWGAEGIGVAIAAAAMGVPLRLDAAVGIYAAGILVGALTFLPGGVGTTEATMAYLFVLTGMPLSTAIALTLVCRAATLWFAVVLGAAAMALLYVRGLRDSSGTAA
jgi:glycosyltransferase 2 family protein